MGYRDIARELVLVHEGLRLKPYRDTLGKLTIGVGRNLEDRGISKDEALTMLENDLIQAETDASSLVVSFVTLSPRRKAVLIDMCLNMGRARVVGFKQMLVAIGQADFAGAASEMLNSKWAQQVPTRAQQLAGIMRAG